jgi:ComF family protein
MEGVVREAIHNLKYRNYRALAPELGGLLALYVQENRIPATVIAPVPLHGLRIRERGYNQSELVARELGKLTGLSVETAYLKRTKNSSPQVSVANREERRRNAQGAFEALGDLRGQKVLLIDDVCTTGSTLAACSAALKVRGALEVWGLTVAREA